MIPGARMRSTRALFLVLLGSWASDGRGAPEARPSGVVESALTRLAQIDVSLSGPREEMRTLTPDDFFVKVNLRRVTDFSVDVVCPAGAPAPEGSRPAPVVRPRPVSFLVYFDQPHLTLAGRQRAIDAAREILPRLLSGGNRVTIVSSARSVQTIVPFTSDPDAIRAALDRLESDRTQWDDYARGEAGRLAEVIAATEGKIGSIARGMGVARRHYQEDRFRGERDLRRLSMTIGQLADVEPPKVVLYFADTMRDDPGRIYLDLFSSQSLEEDGFLPPDSHPLDRVIQDAAAMGVRFYPVQAEGMVAPSASTGRSIGGLATAQATKTPTMAAVRAAQGTLAALAAETGGVAFLNGIAEGKIVERIEADLSCMALLSFEPAGFPLDTPLVVTVESKRRSVTARARGQLVLQSEDERRTARLLAAFLTPNAERNDMPIRASLIPAGYEDGAFVALLQVAVAGAPAPGAAWDLGASVVSRDRVREGGSGRIVVGAAGVPVFFEKRMRFSPGPYEIVSVAHDATSGQIASRRDEGTWPDPDSGDPSVGPIAIVQPGEGAYLRDGQPAHSGMRAQSEEDPVRTDRPTAAVTIVCRGGGGPGSYLVTRRLEGESSVDFPPVEVELRDERCAQIRDLIPPGSMTSGIFHYRVSVSREGESVARGERSFPAVQPGPDPGAEASGTR